VTSSLDGIAEVMARGGCTYRFVVNLQERTCSCRAWEVSGLPCKHAIAYITSIPGEKIEDHVDNYYFVQSFRDAYDGTIPSIRYKSMWPKKSMVSSCIVHVAVKEPRVGISVRSVSNMDIIGTLVRMVTQQT
jgi:hypothetical protein